MAAETVIPIVLSILFILCIIICGGAIVYLACKKGGTPTAKDVENNHDHELENQRRDEERQRREAERREIDEINRAQGQRDQNERIGRV